MPLLATAEVDDRAERELAGLVRDAVGVMAQGDHGEPVRRSAARRGEGEVAEQSVDDLLGAAARGQELLIDRPLGSGLTVRHLAVGEEFPRPRGVAKQQVGRAGTATAFARGRVQPLEVGQRLRY